jgi:membrane protein DedA with SNARE-associated domain
MFLGTFVALVAAGVGVPIPEEIPVIAAGIWAAHNPDVGPIRWLILPVCILGILISDVLLFSIGRFGGGWLLQHRWVARLMPPEKRERIESNFHHYGIKILLFVRWLPGIRSPMFITAGLMRVPLWRFVVADGIAATMGHSLLFFMAFWFGDQFRDLVVSAEEEVNKVRPLLIMLALAAVALFFLIRYLRRPVTTGDPKELPIIGEKVAAGIESLEHTASFLGRHKEEPTVKSQGSGDCSALPSTNHEHRASEELEKARNQPTDS